MYFAYLQNNWTVALVQLYFLSFKKRVTFSYNQDCLSGLRKRENRP